MVLGWKTGFEIELLAPKGKSRLDLARQVADRVGGTVRRIFTAQAELSAVKGKPTFQNLTPGFAVEDADGALVAQFVDDLTLVDGLDQKASSLEGWLRIVSDDSRLISLLMENCDPEAPLGRVLDPIAALFGVESEPHASGLVRVRDRYGSTIAIAAKLPGERERGCEIITPPIEQDHEQALALILADAVAAGFLIPQEGAIHVHFDATPLLSASAIARLVQALELHGESLKNLVGTNPHCRRLGPWPDGLIALVEDTGFLKLDWPLARKALGELELSKYCDFNLLNIAKAATHKHTFEVRILPVCLDAAVIVAQAELFASILAFAATSDGPELAPSFDVFVKNLPLSPRAKARWTG